MLCKEAFPLVIIHELWKENWYHLSMFYCTSSKNTENHLLLEIVALRVWNYEYIWIFKKRKMHYWCFMKQNLKSFHEIFSIRRSHIQTTNSTLKTWGLKLLPCSLSELQEALNKYSFHVWENEWGSVVNTQQTRIISNCTVFTEIVIHVFTH